MSERPEFTVRNATMEDVPGVARVLSRAFFEDPLTEWLFPDPVSRMAKSARWWAAYSGYVFIPRGRVRVAVEDGPRPVVRGAAAWKEPEEPSMGPRALLRTLPNTVSLFGLRRLPELSALLREIGGLAPASGPYWHLEVLGVDPVVQGKGVGAALLDAGLSRADDDRVPVHLETNREENLAYYERYGFAPTGKLDAEGMPRAWGMLRPAP
ncbi:GNAT family N-acetyltransferase [Nocardiopsis potens]|uniref:GNAT family N-acetyltransferase n=1 Tax=Nocardiopsis potens TaxID=1246458 RepID=UPI000345C589|nr:GNAT family N-acetyltransferase [Nocardiopsis potens]